MNGVRDIISSFVNTMNGLVNKMGNWGSYAPVDDSKSGIKIGDKIYNTVVSLNGCYWYIDESGKKQSIAQLPKTLEWSWINIAEKVIKDLRTCYRTLGGKVEVWSWYLLNDQMDTLKEQHKITDSTDPDNPIGTLLTKIPENWRMIDCDLPDMTERDVIPVNECYSTENGGKVNIEGLRAIDDKNVTRESIYTVLQSTDDQYPKGTTFSVIPNEWDRIVCDFPDMTKRLFEKVDVCYVTPGGKVHLNGYKILDPEGGPRKEYYIVTQTTDEDIERLSTLTSIPENWNQVVCDFPDETTSDTEIIYNCYKTEQGKVELRIYIVLDAHGDPRESRNVVMQSTDPNYNTGAIIEEIPTTWLNIECDFASKTQRHVIDIRACYENNEGKVYVEGYNIMDNEAKSDKLVLTVLDSNIGSVPNGTVWNNIPDGFTRVSCNCNCFS